jgi:hypothetical protein
MRQPEKSDSARGRLLNQTPSAALTTTALDLADQPDEGRRDKNTAEPLDARAIRFLESPPAKYPLDIVFCGRRVHRHRPSGGQISYQRSLPCRPSQKYTVQVVHVVPDSAAPYQQPAAAA